MNQQLAWLWGVGLWPPLRDDVRSFSPADTFKRRHLHYGLLIGRVFFGFSISRPR